MSDEQINGLREALQHSPANPPLLKLLAEALVAAGRFSEAEETWRSFLQHGGEVEAGQFGLARCYFEQGKDQAALLLCEEILTRRSDDAPANLLAARCHYRQGDLAAAGEAYHKAKTKDGGIFEPALEDLLDNVGAADDDADEESPFSIEKPDVDFSQVGGMETVKEAIRMKIIHPLAHADLFKAYGKTVGGGLLLYGPPGCGKTHIARATAGEVKANFLTVGISDILDMWIGASENNLARLFEQARSKAPCVLFFDEVDALAASRRDMRQSASRQLINQFLSELDGIQASNEGVLIIAATNAPWHLDSAFRRPGRFDSIQFVPPPDLSARASVLQVLLKGKPTDRIDADAIAKKTEGFSGADLKGGVERTVEAKLQKALATGTPEPITTKDLLAALKKSKATTREWLASAKNHALYANQDGTYDEVLDYLKVKR